MRLIAPVLFCMIGATAGAVVAMLFRKRGTSVRGGALAGVLGGFLGLWLRDVLDVDLGEVLLGSLLAVLVGGAATALAVNLVASVASGGGRRP